MARSIIGKTNTDPAGSYSGLSYPYGKIRDDSGAGDGTPVNTQVYGDFHQFFAKLMADAGLAFNGQPENATNGFQYNIALNNLMYKHFGSGFTFTNSGANVWDNDPVGGKFHCMKQGSVGFLAGVIKNISGSSPGTSDFLTLPVDLRPQHDRYVTAWSTSPTPGIVLLKIATNGKITSTSGCDGTVYFDNISYNLEADAY